MQFAAPMFVVLERAATAPRSALWYEDGPMPGFLTPSGYVGPCVSCGLWTLGDELATAMELYQLGHRPESLCGMCSWALWVGEQEWYEAKHRGHHHRHPRTGRFAPLHEGDCEEDGE